MQVFWSDKVELGKVRLNNVNGDKEEGEEGDERNTVLHQLPDIEQPSEKTRLIADDILVALGDQHSQPFYALVAAKNPRKRYPPKALRDKTREDALTRKGLYQRNEGIRYRCAPKERDVVAYFAEERPVPDITQPAATARLASPPLLRFPAGPSPVFRAVPGRVRFSMFGAASFLTALLPLPASS
jgi:hypothetical protein